MEHRFHEKYTFKQVDYMVRWGIDKVFKGSLEDAEDFVAFLDKYYQLDEGQEAYVLVDKSLRDKQLETRSLRKTVKETGISNKFHFMTRGRSLPHKRRPK